MKTQLFFKLIIVCFCQNTFSIGTSIEVLEKPKKCALERIAKMMGYTCSNLNLKDVPQNLKTGIQVLDLSHNRIRELKVNSYKLYTDIKYLYLFENIIMEIEEGFFKQLSGLEALDLSNNGITTVPIELFYMKMLRNLYLQGNKLIHLEFDLAKISKPIKSPFQIISLANCHLYKIPDFGILPDLWSLNISGNSLLEIDIKQFSPICNLKTIDFNDTNIPKCQCQLLNRYLTVRQIRLENMKCDFSIEVKNNCPRYEDVNDTIEFYKCREILESRELDYEAKSSWLAIAGSLFGFLVIFTGFLWILHRRNVAEIKRRQSLFVKGISIKHDNGQPEKLITAQPNAGVID